jgi:hypothetical protein
MRRNCADMNMNGLSVVPRERDGEMQFVVRFRWIDPNLWADLGKTVPQMTPFATGGEMVLRHCPGCGHDLIDWAKGNPNEFKVLLEQVID